MIVTNEYGVPREWNEGFPAATIPDLIRYIAQKWSSIQAGPNPFSFREKEPVVTVTLAHDLDDHADRQTFGLPGRFQPECAIPKPGDKPGRMKIKGRSDISYILQGRATLILEFKKLDKNKRLRERYWDDGMIRFVNGLYAKDQNVGMMVGLISGDKDNCIRLLEEEITDAETVLKIFCLPGPGYSYVHRPSSISEEMVEFDTLHSRSSVAVKENIRLGHTFLEFMPAGSGPAVGVAATRSTSP